MSLSVALPMSSEPMGLQRGSTAVLVSRSISTRSVIHHETVDLGRDTPVPPFIEPSVDLAPDQHEAVSHLVGPARIIAPAGSGKTRVLTARVRHLIEDRGIEPEILTALAYNRRAAAEMVERLPGGSRLNVRTIHSLGWEILRMAKPGIRLIEEREQRRRLEPISAAPPRANTDTIGPYLEALDEVRIGLRDPEQVEAERDDVPGFTETFGRYREGLERAGEADHSEQIYGAIEALCRLPDLRARWQAQCRHLLVDEFQDLTPAYLLLIRLVASPGLDVFGVGDDDQVIYGYAGADPGFLIDFEDLFPGATSHALEVNYRSPADVVESAINLLGYNKRRVDKTIRSVSERQGLEIVSMPGDELGMTAANHIATAIEGGAEPEAIAVLSRVNSSLLPVHVALSEAEVPVSQPAHQRHSRSNRAPGCAGLDPDRPRPRADGPQRPFRDNPPPGAGDHPVVRGDDRATTGTILAGRAGGVG